MFNSKISKNLNQLRLELRTYFSISLTQSMSQMTNLAQYLLSPTLNFKFVSNSKLSMKSIFRHDIILNIMKSIQSII